MARHVSISLPLAPAPLRPGVGRQHTAPKKDMFTIIPYGRGQSLDSLNSEAADLLAPIAPDAQLCEPGKRPFVELSYEEIPEQDIEQLLGYAGITKANAPVGLPCAFEPRKCGRDYLLFPLAQLEAHIRKVQPDVAAEYESHASIVQFLESRDVLAREYLIAGLLECIKWCYRHRAVLTIRW
jgi:hypothetical protein